MTDLHLAAIRERHEKATPGPWWSGLARDGFSFSVEGPDADSHPAAQRLIRPDAEFIANARTDLPALLTIAERALDRNSLAAALHADRDHTRDGCALGNEPICNCYSLADSAIAYFEGKTNG
jgi:hypothetical protein